MDNEVLSTLRDKYMELVDQHSDLLGHSECLEAELRTTEHELAQAEEKVETLEKSNEELQKDIDGMEEDINTIIDEDLSEKYDIVVSLQIKLLESVDKKDMLGEILTLEYFDYLVEAVIPPRPTLTAFDDYGLQDKNTTMSWDALCRLFDHCRYQFDITEEDVSDIIDYYEKTKNHQTLPLIIYYALLCPDVSSFEEHKDFLEQHKTTLFTIIDQYILNDTVFMKSLYRKSSRVSDIVYLFNIIYVIGDSQVSNTYMYEKISKTLNWEGMQRNISYMRDYAPEKFWAEILNKDKNKFNLIFEKCKEYDSSFVSRFSNEFRNKINLMKLKRELD